MDAVRETDGKFKEGHRPWNTRDTPGCGKPGHDTDYVIIRSDGTQYKRCHECAKKKGREAAKRRHDKYRSAALAAYGNKCSCCGEAEPTFLVIDHVNDDGSEHRKQLNKGGSSRGSLPVYRWLKDHNYPDGFQVLCHNCNYAKSVGGCPHQGGDAQ